MAMHRPRTKHPRGDQLRSIGSTLGESAERLLDAEARLATTAGEVAGEAARVVGTAAARTSSELGLGDGELAEGAGVAAARAAEATASLARDVLESGGAWTRAMTTAAMDAVADAIDHRERAAATAAAATDMPPVPGPS
jgi:hypothetical protein